MGRVIRKWLRYAVTFYLTAPTARMLHRRGSGNNEDGLG